VQSAFTLSCLLLDFNKPSKKLMEQIDHQETRRREMEVRLGKIQEDVVQIKGRQEDVDLQMEELEAARVELLPEANKRRMMHISVGPYTMGGREEDSPDNERPAHQVHISSFYMDTYPVTNQDYREFVNCTGQTTPIRQCFLPRCQSLRHLDGAPIAHRSRVGKGGAWHR